MPVAAGHPSRGNRYIMRRPHSTSLFLRTCALALVVAPLVVAAVAAVAGADAAPRSATAAVAEHNLAVTTSDRRAAEQRLAALLDHQHLLTADLTSSSVDSAEIATQMADARRRARSRAVDAYISGGAAEKLAAVLQSAGPTEASARTAILSNGVETAADAAEQFDRLRHQNDPRLSALAAELDTLARQLDGARGDVAQASAQEADAERAVTVARSAPKSTPKAKAVRARPSSVQPEADPVIAAPPIDGADGWAVLRNCESGGDYSTVSGSGRYRGAYQFNQSTWESVGGVGDPALASPTEQDRRAEMLFASRGPKAWPHCGRFLRS
jgi:hypothetical protein